MRISLIITLMSCVAASSLLGQPQQEYKKQCATDDPEQSIKACSVLIRSGQVSGKTLAVAFLDRGSAYGRKGDYDLALQDYNAALRLNASYANAFYGRGWVYAKKTDYDQAFQDLTHALRLSPNLSGALRERGVAYTHKDDYV
jgi:tetratricopeptide (TPR) repeat protein